MDNKESIVDNTNLNTIDNEFDGDLSNYNIFRIDSFLEHKNGKGLSYDTLISLNEISRYAKKISEDFLVDCTSVDIKDITKIKLPEEFIDYNLTEEEIKERVNPIIYANVELLCHNNPHKELIRKWAYLGLNIRLIITLIDYLDNEASDNQEEV